MKFFSLFLLLYILQVQLLSKDFYKPRAYFYTTSEFFASNNKEHLYYMIQDINSSTHIKNKMGYCITEYEIKNFILYDCQKTFNTLSYYITKPEGLLRKDVLEFYHDKPLEEIEKDFKSKRTNDENLLFKYRYQNDIIKKNREMIIDGLLDEMRIESIK